MRKKTVLSVVILETVKNFNKKCLVYNFIKTEKITKNII